MKKQDFYFELPEELIAQYPLKNRSDSRLLTYSRQTKQIEHHIFSELVDLLSPGDLLVMNDSKVIPARLYGHKASGGKIELLVERITGISSFTAHIKASKAPKPGALIYLDKGWVFEVQGKREDLYLCRFLDGEVGAILDDIGHIPLPLYIHRKDEASDLNRYQTVYAKHQGSVAAPTAGLHFDDGLLDRLRAKGIEIDYVTLHIGSGTFRPVRTDSIYDHAMHQEWFTVREALCERIKRTQASGHRVIAVGTTAMRSLESAAVNGQIEPQSRDTDIFIYPGYKFKVCDGLITNFHLPESTLLMLVSAFVGLDEALRLYQTAIDARYRFYSYGDANLLL
jgi:S-adenosylmethionine:tRNA ribosyltransferase-isomerase